MAQASDVAGAAIFYPCISRGTDYASCFHWTVQHTQRHLRQSYPRQGEELGALNGKFVISNETVVERSSHEAMLKPSYSQNLDEKFQVAESIESEEEVEVLAKSNFDAGDDVDSFSNAGSEAYEVDKKAGEFIAKFGEQMRLQKTTSIDASSVLDVTEDHYQ